MYLASELECAELEREAHQLERFLESSCMYSMILERETTERIIISTMVSAPGEWKEASPLGPVPRM